MAYKHFFKRIIQFCYTFSNESSTERKNSTASHRNPKKTTTFAFNKRSVTSMRKCPIVQHVESDSGHSTKRLKRGGTTRICKAVKYNDLHLSPHSVYLSKQRLYRLKWIVTDNQWCKYAVSKSAGSDVTAPEKHNALLQYIQEYSTKDTPLYGGVIIQDGSNWLYSKLPIENTTDLLNWDAFYPKNA